MRGRSDVLRHISERILSVCRTLVLVISHREAPHKSHEVSHAFDSTGAQYVKDGNLANWWTEEDLAAFQERNARLA
ncbi:MAG: hypothetical protein IKE22_06865, partial [Atopobiaceae bacterium]|nr:hypothetical protein [Atopobiaceae bacterium]